MKRIFLTLLITLATLAGVHRGFAQGTAITYQGRLNNGASAVTGSYDLTFTLFGASSGGSAIAGPVTNSAVGVTNGLFTATFDLAGNFPGADRWLEIGVGTNGSGVFTTLGPRQKLTPTPYAITAGEVTGTNFARLNAPNTALPATGHPIVTSGFVTGAVVGNGGSGYSTAPAVTVNDSTGSGAVISATVSNGSVVALTVNNAGNNYSPGATLTIGAPPPNNFQVFLTTNFFGGVNLLTNKNNVFAGNGAGLSGLWLLNGNAGANPANNNFLGTTDNQPLEIRVNNVRALRIEPNTNAANIIAGSADNSVAGGVVGATIAGGGARNYGDLSPQSYTNRVEADFGTIGGGAANLVQAQQGTVAGGFFNIVQGGNTSGTIGGGENNSILGAPDATIGGGFDNTILSGATGTTISGGSQNVIYGFYSTIGGGLQNSISGSFGAAIGGGYFNTNGGLYGTIPGGRLNLATNHAFAAGYRAKARHDGAFVWADFTEADFSSTATNQFLIRASGGVGIGTTAPDAALHVANGSAGTVTANANSIAVLEKSGVGYLSLLTPAASESGIVFGSPNSSTDGAIIFNNSATSHGLQFRTGTNATQMAILANGNVGVGTTVPSRELEVQNTGDTEIGIKSTDTGGHLWTLQASGVSGSATLDASFQIIDRTSGGTRLFIGTNGLMGIGTGNPTNKLHVAGGVSATAFVLTSDRNAKENFAPVDPQEVLARVASLPITRWNYKEMNDGQHIGPMAQDFYAAFRLGGSDKTITSIDPDGVALAAIQGLNQKLTAELKRRDAENAGLKERLQRLEEQLVALAARVPGQ